MNVDELEIAAQEVVLSPDAKKRYAAMKKYFTYTNKTPEFLRKPYVIEYERKKYTSFCNSWSLALTTESCGEMEMFDGEYP